MEREIFPFDAHIFSSFDSDLKPNFLFKEKNRNIIYGMTIEKNLKNAIIKKTLLQCVLELFYFTKCLH